ncbi:kynureninase [Saprospiraceae bacterium]|jgi:kynureninase|nr:kynureninase [Saprospiraceae bacterium]
MTFENSLSYAQGLDQIDPLRSLRVKFYFPQHNGRNAYYFCGNSLGLQPKGIKAALDYELEHWKTHAVEGHFRGEMPWMYYHKFLLNQSANLVGAKPEEVVVMNTLTVNLHLMMVSFYRPTKERFKIIMEGGAFPSDQYAIESQIRFHGFLPEDAIIEVSPREGEENLRTEDILSTIEKHGEETALVLFGGVNYYTGQFFDLEKITKKGHEVGAKVGFDLAHTAGNLPLQLHDWNVDFAVWCSYKYLNSAPGGPSGVFVHERHGDNRDLPRFAGWWGHDEEHRFLMKKGFVPMKGAAGWQLSNVQILSCAAHKVSLDMFEEVGMPALREKSLKLTGYLIYLIEKLNEKGGNFNIITPKTPEDRGAQLSILTGDDGKALFDYLTENGVITDWREPNVIRLAPVPMYNNFEDVWWFAEFLNRWLDK